MDGFILRLPVVAMAYRNQADSPMTSYTPVLNRPDTTRPPQHLVSGAISGAPLNLSYLLTNLASNMWEITRPTYSQDYRAELRDHHRLGGNKICRNRPCMGLKCQARQSELPHLHGWVHYNIAPKLWTPLPRKTTTLTAQTL